MSLRRSFVWILSAGLVVALTGCPSTNPQPDRPTIELDGGGDTDGGGGTDGGMGTDAQVGVCDVSMPGTVPGANCNRGMCQNGMTCNGTINGALSDIPTLDGTETSPYPISMYTDELMMPLGGGHCGNTCDPDGPTTQCGECGICADAPLQGRVRLAWVAPDGSFDFDNGLCAFPCVPSPTDNGGCREGYACDTLEAFCGPACVNDTQCQIGVAANEFGVGDIIYDGSDSPWVCNTTTGMCEPSTPTGDVGDACERNADCPGFGGLCIQGTCWQGGCGFEGGFACADGDQCVGIESLGRVGFCIPGCTTGDDCLTGNGCVALTSGDGICFPSCEADSECRTDERCDLSFSTDGTSGLCQPGCDAAAPDSCGEDEICEAAPVEGGGTATFCHAINQVCEADADCNGGQRCELWPTAAFDMLGMCQDACADDGDCDAGSEFCNTSTGNCRSFNGYCAADTDCGGGQSCVIASGRESGNCESP